MRGYKGRFHVGLPPAGAGNGIAFTGYGALVALGCGLCAACFNRGDCPGQPGFSSPFCYIECRIDADCQTPEAELNACMVRVCSQSVCLPTGICEENEDCIEGECRRMCADDIDCDDEIACTLDTCRDGFCNYGPKCPSGVLCDRETGCCGTPPCEE